jgi:hypothetical protein
LHTNELWSNENKVFGTVEHENSAFSKHAHAQIQKISFSVYVKLKSGIDILIGIFKDVHFVCLKWAL